MNSSEDVVQELFYTVWKDRTSLRIVWSVKSYLYGAVRNQSLQYLERLNVRRLYHQKMVAEDMPESDPNDSPQQILEYRELEQRLEFVLEKMPKRRRDIFRRNRFEGKKYEEIAREMSLSVKSIEAEISKALQELRKSLKFQV